MDKQFVLVLAACPGPCCRSQYMLCVLNMDMVNWTYSIDKDMQHLSVHAACPSPYCVSISMLHVHVMSMLHVQFNAVCLCNVHTACPCPCCTSMSMLHARMHAACSCPRCMFKSSDMSIHIKQGHCHRHAAQKCSVYLSILNCPCSTSMLPFYIHAAYPQVGIDIGLDVGDIRHPTSTSLIPISEQNMSD